jgi:hypothetical protein
MYELPGAIPDAQLLLTLEPEELGAKLLFLLRKREEKTKHSHSVFHLSNLLGELWPQNYVPGQTSPYPSQLRPEIDLAISEAWSWLNAQGLLVDPGSPSSSSGPRA